MKSLIILPFSPTIFLYACAHVCTLPSYGDNIYDVWYSAIHWLQILFFLALRIIWNGYYMIWSVMFWNFPDQFLNVGSLDHLFTFSYFLSLWWTLQWITEKPLNSFQSQNLGDEITGEKSHEPIYEFAVFLQFWSEGSWLHQHWEENVLFMMLSLLSEFRYWAFCTQCFRLSCFSVSP